MDSGLKREVWKIFSVAAFLFITIVFILPYLVQISTTFHEKGHINALIKYGVRSGYSANLLETIPNFFNPNVAELGVTRFDITAYQKLDKYEKAEINMAGIISDLRFLFLIGVLLSLNNIYLFYKIRIKKDYKLIYVLAVNWILFMWLLALIQITIANITYPNGDFYQLVNVLS